MSLLMLILRAFGLPTDLDEDGGPTPPPKP